ncbi:MULTISPECIES: DMT family transporter [Paraburkholderia]|uniref:EamA-like transporter family protein n=1 Tax=Paraburkholderia tropica TaxID=92647 RepID=A0ABX5MBJ0_9BURK|nr:DMT family transporter [Paraburkholderia tropica]MBB2984491.1 drug/metabolite transporter (DMT)-like permease [Paraburkholderia tropica]MBB3004332.1 drug/metabolite transporter (DMT)-like permease [Paraburkholderia tropica]MBB6324095.1 drug/metabolite transporter (DMT)-like permease [Paraburkholderia tropica]MDE1139740.1 DMT family transporter [Paraburkholderia tropica]OBR54385.1 multidrug DMT transporter permease [Paraburkholderia tropica]
MLASLAPALFVALWSTGFVVARAIAPYADPNLFLLARFAGTAALFACIALAMRAPWPRGREIGKHLFAGALLQGVYLGAGYWAVAQGLSAGVMALLGALQPLLTATLAAPLFGERISTRRWQGMSLGLAGVVLVLMPKLSAAFQHASVSANANADLSGAHANPLLVVVVAVLAVGAITAGTLYQKTSLAQADIRSASAVQNAGAAIVAALLALALGEHRWIGSATLWISLAWGIAMLSGAGVTLLVWMVRHGEAARATALLYLAPPLAALESWLLFRETLAPIQIAGFGVALAGVLIARRG